MKFNLLQCISFIGCKERIKLPRTYIYTEPTKLALMNMQGPTIIGSPFKYNNGWLSNEVLKNIVIINLKCAVICHLSCKILQHFELHFLVRNLTNTLPCRMEKKVHTAGLNRIELMHEWVTWPCTLFDKNFPYFNSHAKQSRQKGLLIYLK